MEVLLYAMQLLDRDEGYTARPPSRICHRLLGLFLVREDVRVGEKRYCCFLAGVIWCVEDRCVEPLPRPFGALRHGEGWIIRDGGIVSRTDVRFAARAGAATGCATTASSSDSSSDLVPAPDSLDWPSASLLSDMVSRLAIVLDWLGVQRFSHGVSQPDHAKPTEYGAASHVYSSTYVRVPWYVRTYRRSTMVWAIP